MEVNYLGALYESPSFIDKPFPPGGATELLMTNLNFRVVSPLIDVNYKIVPSGGIFQFKYGQFP